MRVLLHNNLQSPQQLEASRVVITDDFGNPLAAAIQIADNTILVEKAGDSTDTEFNSFLRQLGISQTVIVQNVDASDICPPRS